MKPLFHGTYRDPRNLAQCLELDIKRAIASYCRLAADRPPKRSGERQGYSRLIFHLLKPEHFLWFLALTRGGVLLLLQK